MIEDGNNGFIVDPYDTDAFAEKIDLANSNMILQYGAGTQKKIADFSEKASRDIV